MKQMDWKKLAQSFLSDESGQTTTEYILILAVVVTLIMQFKKTFSSFMQNLLGQFEQDAMQAADIDY